MKQFTPAIRGIATLILGLRAIEGTLTVRHLGAPLSAGESAIPPSKKDTVDVR